MNGSLRYREGLLMVIDATKSSNTREISHSSCMEEVVDSKSELILDWHRAMVQVRKKNYTQTMGSYLGFIWLFLDPLIMTLVYLFVFTVISYNEAAGIIFIGLGMIRGMQHSLSAASSPLLVKELNAANSIIRPRTRVTVISTHVKLLIDTLCMGSGISIVLFGLGASLPGAVAFTLVMLMNNLFWHYIGLCLLNVTTWIPDVHKLVSYFGMGMFFASPVLYTFSRTEGLHREFSQLNPMTYAIELARKFAGFDSGFSDLPVAGYVTILVCMIFTMIFGISRLDSLRWSSSTVS